MKFRTVLGNVNLTKAVKLHIIQRHPIMEDYFGQLKEVLESPQELRYSSRSDDVLLFYRYFDKIESGKYVAVVVNTDKKSVITTYLTDRIKTGRKYEEEQ